MKYLLPLLLLCLLPLSPAHAQLPQKDSFDYLSDDGIMTPEEMEEEADYVHTLCEADPYKKTLFDCACLAGAFLIEREAKGPLEPQDQIVYALTTEGKVKCPNTTAVAGQAWQDCQSYNQFHRELATDGEAFCGCVSNRVARDYAKKPLLSPDYIGGLTTEAYVFCEDVSNRPKPGAAETNEIRPVTEGVLNGNTAVQPAGTSSIPPKSVNLQ